MIHPDCEHIKRVHLLDETHVPDWGLLQAVRPIFAATDCNWRLQNDTSGYDYDEGYQISSDNLRKFFKDELKRLPTLPIEHDLPCDIWENCITNLSSALRFLNSLVKEDIILLEKRRAVKEKHETEKAPAKSSLVDTVWGWLESISTSDSPSPTDALLPASNDSQLFSDPLFEFSKLRALAKLLSRGDFDYVRAHEVNLNLEQKLEVYRTGCWTLKDFNSCVEEADKSRSAEFGGSFNAAQFSRTNWKDEAPSQASIRLHHILRTKISHCQCERHETLLKMNGLEFEQITFDMFIVPCSKQDRLQEVRFSPRRMNVQALAQNLIFVHRLCDTIEQFSSDESPAVVRFFFEDRDEASQSQLRCIRSSDRCDSDISVDTTLESLVKEEYMLKPSEGGAFDRDDKAVLELSLAQSLLHLLRSPWMEKTWSAPLVRFVRQQDTDELLDINHPYISYLLQPLKESKAEQLSDNKRLAQYTETITSFARMLLEIETGKAVDLIDSISTDTKRLNNFLDVEMNRRDQNYELRSNVQKAIDNCLKFLALLEATRQAGPQGSLDYQISEVIYMNIIQPLEKNLSSIPNHGTMLVRRNLRIRQRHIETAVDQGPFAVPIMPQMPIAAQHHHKVRKVMMFDGRSRKNQAHIDEAQEFWTYHQDFYKTHIGWKGQARESASQRIRIAVLDTGIAENDTFVKPLIDKISESRCIKACEEVKEARKNGTNRPFPQQRDFSPIKAIESFVGRNDPKEDTCGHGTTTAGLLLRVAPDADIYIAKVANGIKFEDIGAVVRAIQWAAGHDVDILSMSFGTRGYDLEISKALDTIPAKTIMLSSASNGGMNRPRTYPATDDRVIAVHAISGDGDEGSINPTVEKQHDALATLGYGIKTSWENQTEFRDGTSYSTPIAAGIIANYLEWVEYVAQDSSHEVTEEQKNTWRSRYGVRTVLTQMMSEEKVKLRFVAPWLLWSPDKDVKDSDIVSKLRTHPGF